MKKNLTSQERKKLFQEQIAKRFLSVLTEKGASWVKNWRGPSMAPINGVTKYKYRGINRFMLALVDLSYGSNDLRWHTFNQFADHRRYYHKGTEWHLKEGSKCVYVEYYYPYDTKEHKNLTWKEYHKLIKDDDRDPAEFYLKARYSAVFNASQIEGIEPYVAELQTYDSQPNDTVLELAKAMDVKVAFDGGDRAFYRPKDDSIHLPKAEHFFSSVAWAATTLHELTHASGAEKRLNRIGITQFQGMFSERYAYEELVSEIGSCMMMYNLDIEESEDNIKNHEAYVASWIEDIREKPEALTNAIKEAQKAVDYMMSFLDDSESSYDDESEEVFIDVA